MVKHTQTIRRLLPKNSWVCLIILWGWGLRVNFLFKSENFEQECWKIIKIEYFKNQKRVSGEIKHIFFEGISVGKVQKNSWHKL